MNFLPDLIAAGWREWVSLPDLNISRIKAKIDTGARTSALHAFSLKFFKKKSAHKVRFLIHPYQKKLMPVIECKANLKEMRFVTDSGGRREERPVIETVFQINLPERGVVSWPIEITLTSRDEMNFKMLLGRTAMVHRITIDPAKSYLWGKKKIL